VARVYTSEKVDGQGLDDWLAALCMAENNRPVYNAHPQLLHAYLGEKSE